MPIPTQATPDEQTTSNSLTSAGLRLVFITLLASTGLLYWLARRRALRPGGDDNSERKSGRSWCSLHPLQRRYLIVYVLAMLSDWLQGPYVYALYESYGFDRHQNAGLFVCGFAGSMLLGTFIGSLADRCGRKRFCLLYCGLYVLSCLTKHVPSYPVLMLGRLLGGMATSLLFSVFDAWFICEASTTNQADLIPQTFGIAVALNSITAIFAGVLAQASVSIAPMQPWTPFFNVAGYCSPFDLSIISLLFTAVGIQTTWRENFGAAASGTTEKSEGSGGTQLSWRSLQQWTQGLLQSLRSDRSIIPLGSVQALYEASMYIFVFMWTPALEQANGGAAASLGLIFACFMTACTAGSQLFRYLSTPSITTRALSSAAILRLVCLAALVSQGIVFMFPYSVWTVLLSFLTFEASVGVYYPSMGTLKAEIVPESRRATIYNLFRVPLNLLVIGALLAKLEVAEAFGVTSLLLALALALSLRITPTANTTDSGNGDTTDDAILAE
ncbi:Molybdate-anion transporter [Perkinsus olseni]|uniref:Molybdate-anion transporter n=1 Tax=Perkinsus olseni TaxID=32597 RepID=A0A7J6MKN4_PEROL|nr:Molybdate-anion transporter [Perkinsus olseni]